MRVLIGYIAYNDLLGSNIPQPGRVFTEIDAIPSGDDEMKQLERNLVNDSAFRINGGACRGMLKPKSITVIAISRLD